jgi:hypothetical protein
LGNSRIWMQKSHYNPKNTTELGFFSEFDELKTEQKWIYSVII